MSVLDRAKQVLAACPESDSYAGITWLADPNDIQSVEELGAIIEFETQARPETMEYRLRGTCYDTNGLVQCAEIRFRGESMRDEEMVREAQRTIIEMFRDKARKEGTVFRRR